MCQRLTVPPAAGDNVLLFIVKDGNLGYAEVKLRSHKIRINTQSFSEAIKSLRMFPYTA